jgi:hypothetical protein
MAITSLNDVLLLAAAGGFGGYTYWVFTHALATMRAKAKTRRGL